jgi:orotate phosphoribosyltransferase
MPGMNAPSSPLPPAADAARGNAARFLEFALGCGALRFGSFTTKAGRQSPYFFNSGTFDDGAKLDALAGFYARRLLESGLAFDLLFGPAYKGITLAAATACALARAGCNRPFCFNRKEAKDHGEGGLIVGAPLAGRVVIVDDVITDGAAKRESIELIRAQGAEPVAVLIALDRQERAGLPGGGLAERSAVQQLEHDYGVPVLAVATLDDLLAYLDARADPALASQRDAVAAYRARYGIAAG